MEGGPGRGRTPAGDGGPRVLAGERGSHLQAACPPAGDTSLPETRLWEAAALPGSAGLEMATLWRVCSQRWVMRPQGGGGRRVCSPFLAFGKCPCHIAYECQRAQG